MQGREPIRLHPDDARARGIADGDVVRVFNDRGSCLAGAVLDADLRRSVVQLSTGAWWDPVSPGRSERARPPRQPQRAHARQGHLAPRAGARSRRRRWSSSSASTGRCLRSRRSRRPSCSRAGREGRARLRQRRPHGRAARRAHDRRRAAASAGGARRARRGARGAAPARSPGRRCATSSAAAARSRSASATARGPSRGRSSSPRMLEELEGLVRLDDVVRARRHRDAPRQHRGGAARDARRRGARGRCASSTTTRATTSSLTWMGRFGADVPVWLNSEWVEADVRITTGFVEPHFFAGFSGGPKLVAPGPRRPRDDADAPRRRAHRPPGRALGRHAGQSGARRRARHRGRRRARTSRSTSCSTASSAIAQAFGGELFAMHEAACALVRRTAMRAGAAAVRRRAHDQLRLPARPEPLPGGQGHVGGGAGGAARRNDRVRGRVPRRLSRARLLSRGADGARPRRRRCWRRSRRAEQTVADQWQIQIQAAIQARSRVIMHTSYLSDAELAAAHLEQTADVEATVRQLLGDAGPEARVCVLPYGPLTFRTLPQPDLGAAGVGRAVILSAARRAAPRARRASRTSRARRRRAASTTSR